MKLGEQEDDRYQAFGQLDQHWADRNHKIVEIGTDIPLYHAGQPSLILADEKTLWTARDPKESEAYRNFDGVDKPRHIYRLFASRMLCLALMPDSILNDFCLYFCDADHTKMAKLLTAWGSRQRTECPASGNQVDGITYAGIDEVLLFRPADTLRTETSLSL